MRVLADACRDPGLRRLFTSLGGTKSTIGAGGGDVYKKLAAQVCAACLQVASYPLIGRSTGGLAPSTLLPREGCSR